jgi:flavorubredoxin
MMMWSASTNMAEIVGMTMWSASMKVAVHRKRREKVENVVRKLSGARGLI